MSGFLILFILGIALGLAIPILVFVFECIFAVFPDLSKDSSLNNFQPRVTILIPAHNEELGIIATIKSLLPQLKNQDKIIVIADNCTDKTADIARQTGVTVLERQNPDQRGKGYALDYGLRFLETDPPDVLVMVDADSRVEPGTLEQITQKAIATGRPVQALYLMEIPDQPTPKDSISALAFLVKNQVRPQGLERLNFPCALTGTGMAFPWSILRQISVASGNIVEDMQLGVDLAIAGHPPLYCPQGRVTGILPQQQQAATKQRTRWEHGHLQTILTQVPRLLKASLQQKRLDLLVMALDLFVPPLSLLVMLWLGITVISTIVGILGLSWQPAIFNSITGGLMLVAIVAAWAKYGRERISGWTLLSVPVYILWKIPLYFGFLVKREKEWVRTERDQVGANLK
ncbi:glycosyl transferase 2 family protein [Lyngbya aestuarii BL J]|uniref:Glycosyl transferase 2 family protein n=1 Tax=Lyngbya aestuarii BL J TaxID=1348334 RepID=U7QIZ2_9CYAN|nr:glycosyltransferase family 2 protein [Lyngbya aestuarii]ERT07914.1 glycosyl transferase 2 family protein [Lyngbya aestuarii BL J]